MKKCIADIQSWMIDDRLLINDDKTEVLVIVIVRRILMLKVKAGKRHAYTLKQIYFSTVSGSKLKLFLQFSAKSR